MSVQTRLRESARQFTATERRIAAYFLEHADALADTSISAVAEACGTSKSMIVQTCKRAGYKGYKDLSGRLSIELALDGREAAPAYGDMHPGLGVAEICGIVMQNELHSLRSTLELLDTDAVARAADAILGARRIHLFGVGNSAVVALDMHNKLQRIGFDSHFSHDLHCQLTSAATTAAGDCAVIFSYTGETRDMITAGRFAREGGATLVSVTSFGQSTVSQAADIALFVAANESLVRSAAMSSRLTMLSMVDVLFSCVVSARHDEVVSLLRRTSEAIRTSERR